MLFSKFLDSIGASKPTLKKGKRKVVTFDNKFKNFKFDKEALTKMSKLYGAKSPSSKEEEYQKQANLDFSDSDLSADSVD